MKNKYHLIFTTLLLVVVLSCKKREFVEATGEGPTIQISKDFEKIEGINVGDKVTIPVNVSSENGVKRLAYFFINETANGTESGAATYFDKDNFPKELTENIEFIITSAMKELVIVSFDKNNRSTELHVPMSEIRRLPELMFKDGIKYRETVFRERHFFIRGTVTSEFDLASITYKTIVNGNVSAENNVPITDKRNNPFVIDIIVPEGLQSVVITAKNIYDGMVQDTFKVGNIAEDAINIILDGNITELTGIYADSLNIIGVSLISGSDMTNLSYAIKTNGTYGTENNIELGSTSLTTFNFDIPINGTKGMETIRISGTNEGGVVQTIEVPINRVYTRLLFFQNIVLTTEIASGKNNWFSAYKAPHVFGADNAAANDEMLDFAFYKNSSTTYRFAPAALFEAGGSYKAAIEPYMVGFDKATYSVMTSTRGNVNNETFYPLNWDIDMETFIDTKIKAPRPQGENYNVSGTNRRVSDNVTREGQGYVFGWGQWDPVNNQAFGLILVKSFSENNGVATVTLDIKTPSEDMRTKYNPVSIFNYP